MRRVDLVYSVFKTVVSGLKIYYVTSYDGSVEIFCFTERHVIACQLLPGSPELADFVLNLQPTASAASCEDEALAVEAVAQKLMIVTPRAPDGRPDTRVTAAKRTTTFKLRVWSFYSAELVEGFHNVNPVTGLDYGDVTVKLYDAQGVEITTEEGEANAVKSVIDWEPVYNFEIIGGYIDIPTSIKDGITDQWYIAAVGVPDYPPQFGGSVDYISEVNLEAVTSQKMISDGRAVSYMAYNFGGMPHTNKMRFILKYPVGVKKRFQVYIEHFT